MFGQIGIFIVTLSLIVLLYFDSSALARARARKAAQPRLLSGPELLFHDGRAAYGKKRYRDAVRMLQHAARIRPEQAMTHYYLGLSHAALGALAEAETAYRETLRRDPNNNIAWNELGDLYRRLKRWEEAADAYEQALRLKPDLASAHAGLESAYACLANKAAA